MPKTRCGGLALNDTFLGLLNVSKMKDTIVYYTSINAKSVSKDEYLLLH